MTDTERLNEVRQYVQQRIDKIELRMRSTISCGSVDWMVSEIKLDELMTIRAKLGHEESPYKLKSIDPSIVEIAPPKIGQLLPDMSDMFECPLCGEFSKFSDMDLKGLVDILNASQLAELRKIVSEVAA